MLEHVELPSCCPGPDEGDPDWSVKVRSEYSGMTDERYIAIDVCKAGEWSWKGQDIRIILNAGLSGPRLIIGTARVIISAYRVVCGHLVNGLVVRCRLCRMEWMVLCFHCLTLLLRWNVLDGRDAV